MENLIKKVGVKELVQSQDCDFSKEFSESLNKKVEVIIKEACTRAKNNGRRRLKGVDL